TAIQRRVDDVPRPQAIGRLFAGLRLDIHDTGLAVHRFDGDDESRAAFDIADFDLAGSLGFGFVAGCAVTEFLDGPMNNSKLTTPSNKATRSEQVNPLLT